MRVTVVPDDTFIQVNGESLVFPFVFPTGLHAIQWDGDSGTAEFRNAPSRPATWEEVEPYVQAWETEKARRVPPEPLPPTPEEILRDRVNTIQRYVDSAAQVLRYDDINSTAKYKDITDAELAALPESLHTVISRYREECRTLSLFAAKCWATGESLLQQIQAGELPELSEAELLERLPAKPY